MIATRPDPLLTVRSLDHALGQGALRKQVLFDISLAIYPGEIVIMTGPSGSGKTTLLTLMGGLRTVQSGSLQFLGQEMSGASQRQLVKFRRQIGYIFQAHNLLPFLTARQNVQLSFELHRRIPDRLARARAEAMLQQVKLGDRINYYPNQLSGGQKQRVAIARALATEPPLVLADEPTAALDGKTGREVVDLMQRLARDHQTTILLVTHDSRILDIADRIIHMEDGRLRAKVLS
ncbi:MAG: ATP-binding cassette domain-containing protein [Leptolyngbya sp. SIO4C1]|nr:ATP-binding cassette domain-containing protein [Leptolyngbya sp. SIO4C1]